jgi:hypothetical protein
LSFFEFTANVRHAHHKGGMRLMITCVACVFR